MAQAIGWPGTVLIVGAYAAVTAGKARPQDRSVLFMNLIGSIAIGISVFVAGAWPAFALQVIWGTIAAAGLTRRPRPS